MSGEILKYNADEEYGMKRFRVLSDLHLDINREYELKLDTEDFCVICGDTAGETDIGVKWIKDNVRSGVLVCGNHLPYNNSNKTLQEQKTALATLFQRKDKVTYFDTDTKCWHKRVDGILFCGTCMYSDMRIKSNINPTGDVDRNKSISHSYMNDYRYGIKCTEKREGVNGTFYNKKIYITPDDYITFFNTAFDKLDRLISENEKKEKPLPVVLITHYPLIKKLIENSFYVDADNFPSYGSEFEWWLKAHPSIKCYCCGHAHDIKKEYRDYHITREDGSRCLVVNNARGYVSRMHDNYFNKDTFVNTQTWEVERIPKTKEEEDAIKKRQDRFLAMASLFV